MSCTHEEMEGNEINGRGMNRWENGAFDYQYLAPRVWREAFGSGDHSERAHGMISIRDNATRMLADNPTSKVMEWDS